MKKGAYYVGICHTYTLQSMCHMLHSYSHGLHDPIRKKKQESARNTEKNKEWTENRMLFIRTFI
ncbi:unnamed protein product [Bacillus thuringiensis DB27]|uniref:Uncharacterized protein n=1 Tax=Bacillus thuringiensis DB27 TaxID=1431339 RepID=W8ZBE9_BACTU|nr:unnamed protein product [Bacillus thuringiensis DB27]